MRALAKARALAPTTWQRSAGLGDGTLTKFLNGTTQSISRPNLNKLADWYNEQYGTNLSGTDLVAVPANYETETQPKNHNIESINSALGLQIDPLLPLVPLWRSSSGGSKNKAGGWMISIADAGVAPRPETMRYTQLANGFKVLDRNNEPVYAYKDTIIIDRDLPAEDGEDCAFAQEPTNSAPAHVILGKLVEQVGEFWVIQQYASLEKIHVSKVEFPNAWPISARYLRR